MANNISVLANFRQVTPITTGFGGEIETLTPAKPGEIISVTVSDTVCTAIYRIPDPPKGRELKVVVSATGFTVAAPDSISPGPVTPRGDILTLTVADPIRHNVDFEIGVFEGPH